MMPKNTLAPFAAVLGTLALAPVMAQTPATSDDYRRQGQVELARLKSDQPITGRARNVIIFIGDGMGVSTITAARIHQGQLQGKDGESYISAMDRLSHTALVKTYSHGEHFTSYDDILDHCCFAWNRLTDQPWRIMSLGLRTWAHRF